jgi:hypothetical protein
MIDLAVLMRRSAYRFERADHAAPLSLRGRGRAAAQGKGHQRMQMASIGAATAVFLCKFQLVEPLAVEGGCR